MKRHSSLLLSGRAPVAIAVTLGFALLVISTITTTARQAGTTGAIAGEVTADRGEVRALRVRVRDTERQVIYTVYTRKGRYRISSLPPGRYEVEVIEETFDSPKQSVDVRAGASLPVDLRLKGKDARTRGTAEAVKAEHRSPTTGTSEERLDHVDFDTLYAPGPAREIMQNNGCFECHSGPPYRRFIHHLMGPRTEAQWRRGVERMFDPKARLNGVQVGAHVASNDRMSAAQKESVIQYLTTQFGPNYKRRDLRLDPLVRNEDALGDAMYVQYELKRELGPPFDDGTKPGPTNHSIAISPKAPGVLWMSGVSSSNIVRVDTRDPSFDTRTKEWRTAPYPENTRPHGLIERAGRLWWAEVGADRIGEMDVKTGQVSGHPVPTAGGSPHDVWSDSKGNLWFSYWSATGKVGRLDAVTKEITESETMKGFSGYGVIVDANDRVWIVGLNAPLVFMRDPTTEQWRSYSISSPARRVTVDSRGRAWVVQYFGNAIAMIDPDAGTVTEHPLPLKYGNPYDVWADHDDNLWIENSTYNSLVKFEPRTKNFTYFPFPDLNAHTYKLDSDPQGTIWFGLGTPTKLTSFKPKGNGSSKQSSR